MSDRWWLGLTVGIVVYLNLRHIYSRRVIRKRQAERIRKL